MHDTMHEMRTSQGGFTLIELMIGIVIITIAAALAVPDFMRWLVQSQLRDATSQIARQLTLARMVAMNRNRSVDVTVQTAGGAVHISGVSPSSGAVVISDQTFPAGVTSVVASPVIVSFSSMGLRTTAGTGVQTIGVCDRYNRQYSVTIAPTGKVNWSMNSGGTPCP